MEDINRILHYAAKALAWVFDIFAFVYWLGVTFLTGWLSSLMQIQIPETSNWVTDLIGMAIFFLIMARAYYVAFKKR